MRIPRRIEWRAGVALLGAAAILLFLLLFLTLTRMDVGLELKGSLYQTRDGWMLSVRTSEERLGLLRRCGQVRIRDGRGRTWYSSVSRLSGRWEPDGGGMQVRTRIAEAAPPWSSAADPSARTVRAMFIERQAVPVLKVLLEGIFDPPGG